MCRSSPVGGRLLLPGIYRKQRENDGGRIRPETREVVDMASKTKNTNVRPVGGKHGEKGFGPAASAGQATTVQVNPNSSVGSTANSGNKK